MRGEFAEFRGRWKLKIKEAKQKIPQTYISIDKGQNTKVLHFQVLKKFQQFMKF